MVRKIKGKRKFITANRNFISKENNNLKQKNLSINNNNLNVQTDFEPLDTEYGINYVPKVYDLPKESLYYMEKGKRKLISPGAISEILVLNTSLKYARIYPHAKLLFVYLVDEKHHQQVSDDDFSSAINKLLYKIGIPSNERQKVLLDKIIENIKIYPKLTFFGVPSQQINFNYIAVKQGHLNILTRKLEDPDPRRFVTSYFPYNYGKMDTPYFDEFMKFLAEEDNDRYLFLMAVLRSILISDVDLQVFIYLYGKGGTGKTTFSNLASALVGSESTKVTSLRAMNTDNFEVVNLMDKKLILIGDTENYTQDLSQFKALTGGDALRGRVMWNGQTIEVRLSGMVLITGNNLLNAKDFTNAILRRYRPLEFNRVPSQVKPLLFKKSGKWQGFLANELPGIFFNVVNTPDSIIESHIRNYDKVPGLKTYIDQAAAALNPVVSWVGSDIVKGQGSYVGLTPKGSREERESQVRRTLYPAYINYCERNGLRNPLSTKTFIPALIQACEVERLNVKKVRRHPGMYIEGIELRYDVYSSSTKYGAPLVDESVRELNDQFPNEDFNPTQTIAQRQKEERETVFTDKELKEILKEKVRLEMVV